MVTRCGTCRHVRPGPNGCIQAPPARQPLTAPPTLCLMKVDVEGGEEGAGECRGELDSSALRKWLTKGGNRDRWRQACDKGCKRRGRWRQAGDKGCKRRGRWRQAGDKGCKKRGRWRQAGDKGCKTREPNCPRGSPHMACSTFKVTSYHLACSRCRVTSHHLACSRCMVTSPRLACSTSPTSRPYKAQCPVSQ